MTDRFHLFIEQYKDRLTRHAFYRIGKIEEAEDIVQDTFVKVYIRKLFLTVENPETYLYRMITNACIAYHRKQKTKYKLQDHLEQTEIQSCENQAIEKIQLQEEFNRIDRILKNLPHKQAEIIRFRVLDELSFKEIAGIVRKPESTVKSRFQYGIEKLRKLQAEKIM